jgi:hypothetical protein
VPAVLQVRRRWARIQKRAKQAQTGDEALERALADLVSALNATGVPWMSSAGSAGRITGHVAFGLAISQPFGHSRA